MTGLMDWWRRRNWHRDDDAIAQLAGKSPATLITGASQGIGFELARMFARHREAVILVARDEQGLLNAKAELIADRSIDDSVRIETIALDVTGPDAAARITAELAKHDLFVDELINNAGIGASGPFANSDPVQLSHLVQLNTAALTGLSHAFLADMLIRGRGGIINMASLGGFAPGPYQAAYYASKAYVISLTRALAHENQGMGVRIATVAPGPVNTKFHAQMGAETAFYRRLLPALGPERVASSTFFWYGLGLTVIVPGLFNQVMALALRVLPGFLTIPVVALLLHPWGNERDV